MWVDFAEQFQEKLGNPAELSGWAEFSLPELHRHLLTSPGYQNDLALAKSKPLERYSKSVTLFENLQIKASLVALEKGRPLPLHDHPGASGLMLVIEGEVSIFQCNAEEPQPGNPLVLNVVELKNLPAGQVSWFTVKEKNIHSVNAVSQHAVLLVVHTPTFSARLQSFYFPLNSDIKAGSKVYAHRINASVFNKDGQWVQNNTQSPIKI